MHFSAARSLSVTRMCRVRCARCYQQRCRCHMTQAPAPFQRDCDPRPRRCQRRVVLGRASLSVSVSPQKVVGDTARRRARMGLRHSSPHARPAGDLPSRHACTCPRACQMMRSRRSCSDGRCELFPLEYLCIEYHEDQQNKHDNNRNADYPLLPRAGQKGAYRRIMRASVRDERSRCASAPWSWSALDLQCRGCARSAPAGPAGPAGYPRRYLPSLAQACASPVAAACRPRASPSPAAAAAAAHRRLRRVAVRQCRHPVRH